MKKIRWGILGLGSIAQVFAKSFNFCDHGQLVAISSQDRNKLNQFQNDFKIEDQYCFNNYKDLIKCNDIDIIYLALPNSLHFKWICECIDQEKNVLVEKPALSNVKESENLIKFLENKSFFLVEGFMYRFHPQINIIIDLIKNHVIGELLSMESYFGSDILTKKNFLGFKLRKKLNEKNRIFNKNLGGGAILDLGCYTTSFSSIIASLKSKFKAINVTNKKKEICSTGVDIDSYGELHFDNNFKSKVGASFSKNIGRKSKIYGQKGEIIIEDTWFGSNSIIVKKNDKNEIIKINKIKNIYSMEIDHLSKNLLENKKQIDISGLRLNDIILNTRVLNDWLI